MYTVDLYLRVRLACHVDGLSQREAASRFGIARETVKKVLRHSEPPGYRRRERAKRPKLDPYIAIIDQYLNEDRTSHRKQRHTAKRIFDRLRAEHGFEGGYTIVKDYVREYPAAAAGGVRAIGASAGACSGGLWRGGCNHRRRYMAGAFFCHGPSL